MTWTLRAIEAHEIEAVRQLLLANGWEGARFAPDRFPALIHEAREALVAVDGARVVGFARTLGDGVSNGYLCTLVVDVDYRKRGIARALVARALGDNLDMTWVLRAERPGLQAFYEKLGWRASTVAMERVRRPAVASKES